MHCWVYLIQVNKGQLMNDTQQGAKIGVRRPSHKISDSKPIICWYDMMCRNLAWSLHNAFTLSPLHSSGQIFLTECYLGNTRNLSRVQAADNTGKVARFSLINIRSLNLWKEKLSISNHGTQLMPQNIRALPGQIQDNLNYTLITYYANTVIILE
jgi:hypothetical protein